MDQGSMMTGTKLRYGMALAAVQLLSMSGCSNEVPPANQIQSNQAASIEVQRPQGDERLILAFGDSLYAGYGLDKGQGLPAQLQNRLRGSGINATVVDAGVSGDTTAAGLQRLAFTLDNLPRTPDLVILGLGGNDALRQISAQQTRQNMTAMMEVLDKRGIKVVLTGMRAPPNLGPDYAKAFEPIWPEMAQRYQAALYPFILENVITDPGLMLADGIHPNAEGIERMADAIAPIAAGELPKQ
jgi:acyl-CoA thioesterase-1